jgi:diacylglycerol kinase
MFRFISSIRFAWNGIFYALRSERNVQIWLGVTLLTLIIAFLLCVSHIEFLIITIWMFLIGAMEYVNTSIELLSDRITTEYDEQIKRVKDMAAGATLLVSTGAVISCMVIFVPKFLEKFCEISL